MKIKPKPKRPSRIDKIFCLPNSSKYAYIEIWRNTKGKCTVTYRLGKGTRPQYETVYYMTVVGTGFRNHTEISVFQYKALVKGAGKPVLNNKVMTKHVIKPRPALRGIRLKYH